MYAIRSYYAMKIQLLSGVHAGTRRYVARAVLGLITTLGSYNFV